MLLPETDLNSALGPIFRVLPGLYLVLKPDLKILDATDAYLQAIKVSREGISERYFLHVVSENTATPLQNATSELINSLHFVLEEKKQHKMPVLSYPLSVSAGERQTFDTRYWSFSNTPVFDHSGNLVYILHEAQDITERIKAEQAREHHNERLNLLTGALNAVAWEYDMVNKKLAWGKGLTEVFGYHPEEMGPGGESWDSRVHPEDFEKVQESIAEAIASQKKMWTGEYRFRKADSTFAHVLDQGYIVYDSSGKPIRTIGSIIDLSYSKRVEEDLKESDARFRHLLENLPHMAWMADPKGKVLYFNDNWYSFTGMPKGQTHGWVNYIHPEDSAEVLTSWYNAIATGSVYELEQRIKDNISGNYRTFLERGVPMYDQNGDVKLWIGTFTDIEDQRQILEEVRLKDQQMEKILQLSPAHLCLLAGPNHTCRYVSPGIYNLFGNLSYIGKTALELWPEFEDLGLKELLEKVYHQEEIVQIKEFPMMYDRLQNLRHEKAYFNIKLQPILDNEGCVEGVLISAVEVTEAVEAKRTAAELALKLQTSV